LATRNVDLKLVLHSPVLVHSVKLQLTSVLYNLGQGRGNYGPWAASGPRDHFMRPVGTSWNSCLQAINM